MLGIHIFIALSSVVCASYLFVSPSKRKFQVSYGLVAMTIASGTYLVFIQPAHMMQACVSGLAYIAVVLVMIASARKRYAKVRIED